MRERGFPECYELSGGQTIVVVGEQLKQVNGFTYLVNLLKSNGSCTKDIRSRIVSDEKHGHSGK